MSSDDSLLLDELRADRARFALLPADRLDAAVGACPGWDLATLLVHTGRIHRWAAAHVTSDPTAEVVFPRRPEAGVNLVPWLCEGLDELTRVFSSVDLDGPCGSFVGGVDRRWWLRRQTVETALHRWDAQDAVGATPDPVNEVVAAVGIGEWCELQALRWAETASDLDATVHLHATDGDGDGDGEWLVEATPTRFTWTEGHHKGDVAVRASRNDLLLILWGRLGHDSAEVFGDATLFGRLLDAAAI